MLNVQVCANKTFKMTNTGTNCWPAFLCIYCAMSWGRWTVWPQGWQNEELFLHHDTAPAHNASSEQKFPATNGKAIVPHLHTSQIYHPVPLCCFLNSNWHWRGGDFMTSEWFQITAGYMCQFQTDDISKCYEQQHHHWACCIKLHGNSFNVSSTE